MKLTQRQQRAKNEYIRVKYAEDLIQPSDNRFKKHYPGQYAEMEKAEEQQEIKLKQKKESKDNFFDKHRNGLHNKEMRTMLKLEEQLDGKK